MSKRTISVVTPVGTFSRTTASAYTHAVVRVPTMGLDAFRAKWANQKVGVFGRYMKDGGYVVSYHYTWASALAEANKGRKSYYVETDVVGVFPVSN